jgi:hypothetical protein
MPRLSPQCMTATLVALDFSDKSGIAKTLMLTSTLSCAQNFRQREKYFFTLSSISDAEDH